MHRHLSLISRSFPVLLSVFALLLGGCALGPEYRRPDIALPETWPENAALHAEATQGWQAWWMRFDDQALDRLVARAVQDNPDIWMQAARVREAQARLGFAEAEQLPTVALQAEAGRSRQAGAALGTPEIGGITGNLFSLAGVLDYEIDLWGRLAREREAAQALLQESLFAHDAVRLSVIADVVNIYFGLQAAQRDLAITERTLETRKQMFELEQIRFRAGETDELTLLQAQAELETTSAQVPGRIKQVRTLEGALAVLAGVTPSELFGEMELGPKTLEDITLPGAMPHILPSALLERRPDIRAAEAGLMAATAGIGIADAQRLPRLNLTGLLGSAGMETGDMFTASAQTWSLGAGLVGPLLDFGRSKARVETAEALRVQAEIQYRATVNIAFNEVRDALVLFQTTHNRLVAVEKQVQTARRTLELKELQYREGFVGLIDVLGAQRALLFTELEHNAAIRLQLTAAATLFKALGGGWMDNLLEEAVGFSSGLNTEPPS